MEPSFPWNDLRCLVHSSASGRTAFTKEALFRGLLVQGLDDEQTGLLCKGIKKLDSAETLLELVSLIGKVCSSPQTPEVHLVCVKELIVINWDSSFAGVAISCGLCEFVCKLVRNASPGLYTDAKDLLAKWSKSDIHACRKIVGCLKEASHSASDRNSGLMEDEIALRLLECAVDIACLSEECLHLALPNLKMLFEQVREGDDILLLMNVIPMVAQIAFTSSGLKVVCDKDNGPAVVDCLFNFLETELDLLELSFLAIADICATASLRTVHIDLIERFLVENLKLLQEACSADKKCLAYESLSHMCAKAPYALGVVTEKKALIDTWFSVEYDNDTLVPQIRSICLALFSPSKFHDEEGLVKIRKLAFEHMSDRKLNDGVQIVAALMQQKDKRVRFAAYEFIKYAANHEWCAKKIVRLENFLPLILDRATENCEAGLSLKFDILKNLAQLPSALGVFADSVQRYLEAGI